MALSNLGDLLASSREERATAETIYKGILQDLTEAAKDESTAVRAATAKALGIIGDKKVVAILKEALKDSEADVRAAAVEALGKIAATMLNAGVMETPSRL
jgi:HEAT repeat protein